MKLLPIALSLGLAFGAVPANAQAMFDQASVSQACSAGGPACAAYINTVIRRLRALGLSPAALNSQLGSLATASLNVARANPRVNITIARALVDISNASTNTRQKRSLTQTAQLVAQNRTPQINPTEAFALSPS